MGHFAAAVHSEFRMLPCPDSIWRLVGRDNYVGDSYHGVPRRRTGFRFLDHVHREEGCPCACGTISQLHDGSYLTQSSRASSS
jgi:hypothetical protein